MMVCSTGRLSKQLARCVRKVACFVPELVVTYNKQVNPSEEGGGAAEGEDVAAPTPEGGREGEGEGESGAGPEVAAGEETA